MPRNGGGILKIYEISVITSANEEIFQAEKYLDAMRLYRELCQKFAISANENNFKWYGHIKKTNGENVSVYFVERFV